MDFSHYGYIFRNSCNIISQINRRFHHLIPSVFVLVGYSAAFYFLSLTLNDMPVGIAYAIWSGVGIVGIAIVAMIFHEQNLDAGAMIGMGLIILGIIVMRTYSTMMLE